MADTSPDTPPDRLSLDPRSPYFDEALLSRGVGIKFNGQEKTSVIEYSISEGWIRVAAGRSRDRYGQPMSSREPSETRKVFVGGQRNHARRMTPHSARANIFAEHFLGARGDIARD